MSFVGFTNLAILGQIFDFIKGSSSWEDWITWFLTLLFLRPTLARSFCFPIFPKSYFLRPSILQNLLWIFYFLKIPLSIISIQLAKIFTLFQAKAPSNCTPYKPHKSLSKLYFSSSIHPINSNSKLFLFFGSLFLRHKGKKFGVPPSLIQNLFPLKVNWGLNILSF